MWTVQGKPVESERFGDFEPSNVLYEFDGPRIFTVRGRDDDLFLAYLCDETDELLRFLIVPCSEAVVVALQHGRTPVRDVLQQPHVWVADVGSGWQIQQLWKTVIESIPTDVLPEPRTMLLPTHQPLFSLRAIGEGIHYGETPGSVIRSVIERSEKCLKTLVDFVLEQTVQSGRPAHSVRHFYDLPAQRLAFNSFEVAFGRPLRSSQKQLPEVQAAETQEEQQVFNSVGDLLQRGLEWIASNPESTSSLEGSDAERKAVFQALLSLTPSHYGLIQHTELGGTLLGQLSLNRPQACWLSRTSRRIVKQAIAEVTPQRERLVTPTGIVEEADRGRLSFELREISGAEPTMRFMFDEDTEEDVLDAFNGAYRVKVVGKPIPGTTTFQAVVVERDGDDPDTVQDTPPN